MICSENNAKIILCFETQVYVLDVVLWLCGWGEESKREERGDSTNNSSWSGPLPPHQDRPIHQTAQTDQSTGKQLFHNTQINKMQRTQFW